MPKLAVSGMAYALLVTEREPRKLSDRRLGNRYDCGNVERTIYDLRMT